MSHFLRFGIICAVLASVVTLPVASSAAAMELASNGLSRYKIVVAKNASETELYAAGELADFIRQMSGTDIPVRTDETQISDYEIVIGEPTA